MSGSKKNSLKAVHTAGALKEKLLQEQIVKIKQENISKFRDELIALSAKYNCFLLPVVRMEIDGKRTQIAIQDLVKGEIDVIVGSK